MLGDESPCDLPVDAVGDDIVQRGRIDNVRVPPVEALAEDHTVDSTSAWLVSSAAEQVGDRPTQEAASPPSSPSTDDREADGTSAPLGEHVAVPHACRESPRLPQRHDERRELRLRESTDTVDERPLGERLPGCGHAGLVCYHGA